MRSPCNFSIKNYEIFYIFYKGNVLSFQCKISPDRSTSTGVRVILLLTVCRSVRLGFEPLTETHSHIFAFRKKFVFVCREASIFTGGRVCHIKESQSLSVLCVCLYILLISSFFLYFIFLLLSIIYKVPMYMTGPGIVQQIMPILYTNVSLDT
jgi:hypothetical protein